MDGNETLEEKPEETSEEKIEETSEESKEKTEETSKKPAKKRISMRWIAVGAVLFVVAAAAVILFLYENSRVYRDCYVEAGVEVGVQDFLQRPDTQAYFVQGSDAIDITVPSDYNVIIKTGAFTHNSVLHITDSIAPAGEAVKVNLESGKECSADAFVEQIKDATAVEVSYGQQPDFSKTVLQEVHVVLTDAGGNATELTAELFISSVVDELVVEAGSPAPTLKDFVVEGENASFFTQVKSFDYTLPGKKIVRLRVDGMIYDVPMYIKDTIAPKLDVKNINSFTKVKRKPEDFVAAAEDVTQLTLAFKEEPDIMAAGEQTVVIIATDAGGNATEKEAKLTLEQDTQAPVINGVGDMVVFVGKSIAYKRNVTVTDNCPEGLILHVDSSAVNLSAEGIYPVTYIARDASGNETRATATVTVKPMVYDVNEVFAIADSILARIITPDMGPYQKAESIYRYTKRNIRYINHSEKGNWVRSAFEGLVDRQGDCYVYASTAKVLLDRAGIQNMDIVKIPARTSHFWNLVNLGEGWYHFDTTPRIDGPDFFMWTEAQLMDYSNRNYGSHNYDHSLYPAVN